MAIPDYPSNSDKNKQQAEEKDIKRVTTGEAKLRKKPLGKRVAETMIGGSPKDALHHMVVEIMIPEAREMIFESVSEGFRALVFGESRRKPQPPPSGATGFINYGQYSRGNSRQTVPNRVMSPQSRARHDFSEIVLETRREAEDVLGELYEVVSHYGEASIADLYGLVGVASSHTDVKWGWSDLRGATVTKVRGGYLLDLPAPQPLS